MPLIQPANQVRDVLSRPIERPYPEVIPTINIPLNQIAITFRRKGIEAVILADPASFLICLLLVLFIMTVIGIE